MGPKGKGPCAGRQSSRDEHRGKKPTQPITGTALLLLLSGQTGLGQDERPQAFSKTRVFLKAQGQREQQLLLSHCCGPSWGRGTRTAQTPGKQNRAWLCLFFLSFFFF